MLTINGSTVKSPSSMEIQLFEVGDATRRNAAGEQIIDRIATKRRISLSWAVMTPEQLSSLFSAMGDPPFFTVSYFDPVTGLARMTTCSCDERSTGILRITDGIPVWRDVTMTWTER